jgi:PAS domain S-box-containing protein
MRIKKPTYQELKERLAEAEAALAALRREEVDAVVSEQHILLLRVKEVEQALRESEEFSSSLLANSPNPIVVINSDTSIRYANPAMEKLTGFSKAELVGTKAPYPWWTEETLEKIHKDFEEAVLKGKGAYKLEEHFQTKSGERFFVEITSTSVKSNGESKYYLGSWVDITERKRVEEALEVSNRFLQIINKQMGMTPLLKEFLAEIHSLTGCAALGVRLLDDAGNIPYHAYVGFNQEFYEKESPLSMKSDQCMCTNVIKGEIDPALPFYTAGGSFYINATSRFLATVSEREKGKTRNECNRVGFESVALVPIPIGDGIHGLVHVADPRENMVPLEMVELLEKVAMQLGTGIHRVKVEEALQKAHNGLEIRVQERTAELVATNEALRHLSRKLLSAQEDERRRIAGDLHDTLGASLAGIKLMVENSLKQIGDPANAANESLNTIILEIQEALDECRRIQTDLRPSMLDDLGLLPTLSWYFRRFQTIYSGIRIEQEVQIMEDDVPPLLKIVVFRVTQESMNNIAKHSHSTLVRLSLRKLNDRMELILQDNGRGFNLEKVASQETTTRGLGLTSMRERTELSGGSFNIESTEGKGTIIRASWPLREND